MRISCYWNKYPEILGMLINGNRKYNCYGIPHHSELTPMGLLIHCMHLLRKLSNVAFNRLEDWVVKAQGVFARLYLSVYEKS